MLDISLPADEIAIHSGLNRKTITNMYHSSKKEIVIEAAYEHYDALYKAVEELTQIEDLNLCLHIKFNKVSVELDINESLIVINTLAVKRAALRGGLWSTAGKQTEGPLMLALCKLYGVPDKYYSMKPKAKRVKMGKVKREIDFFLKNGIQEYKCEVKLMGKGNPESADVVIARNSAVFIADKLSEQNKAQLEERGIEWVELRSEKGFRKFQEILDKFHIPNQDIPMNELEKKIENILEKLFS